MTAIMRRAGVAAVLALTTLAGAGAAVSGDAPTTFKPLAGVSLHLGSKHAIGYYQKADSVCQLTLVVGEEPRGEVIPEVVPARFTAAIEAGKHAQFDTGSGTVLQFACAPGATAMTVQPLKQTAYSLQK